MDQKFQCNPKGEPLGKPVYPIPPPGEYYATARWVKEFVERAVASVDNEGAKTIIDELLASWDPSFAMKRITGYTGQLARFDSEGQVVGSGTKIEDLVTFESIRTLSDAIDNKVDKEYGKGLSTNDFTNELKRKLETLTPGAGGGYSVNIDETLTVSGAAADAAVVGSKVNELKESLETALDEASEHASAAVTAAEEAKRALSSARQKGDNTIYDGDGEPTSATYVSSVVVEDLRTQVEDKVSQTEFSALSSEIEKFALESRVQELSQSVTESLSQRRVKTDVNIYDQEGSPTGEYLATSTDLASKADKSELDGKADKSELDGKADKSELDGKADKSELLDKADKSDLEGKADKADISNLRSRVDLLVYDENGPVESDSIATQSWVRTFLSENYDVAENTSYGTEV